MAEAALETNIMGTIAVANTYDLRRAAICGRLCKPDILADNQTSFLTTRVTDSNGHGRGFSETTTNYDEHTSVIDPHGLGHNSLLLRCLLYDFQLSTARQ